MSKVPKHRTSVKTSQKVLWLSAFGSRLKKLRLAKRFTLQKFSRQSGIDIDSLRKYENGVLEPRLTAITIMAKTLKVTYTELLDFDTTPLPHLRTNLPD